MKRLLIPFAVVALGLMVGAAVSGVPTTVPNDVEASAIQSTSSSASASMSPTTSTLTPPSTSSSVPSVLPDDGSLPATSLAGSGTSDTSATSASDVLVAPADLRVVVANAGARPGTATSIATELRAVGYGVVLTADATARRETSIVVHGPNLEGEARRLANERGIGEVAVRGSDVLTEGDAAADIWLIVGAVDP